MNSLTSGSSVTSQYEPTPSKQKRLMWYFSGGKEYTFLENPPKKCIINSIKLHVVGLLYYNIIRFDVTLPMKPVEEALLSALLGNGGSGCVSVGFPVTLM